MNGFVSVEEFALLSADVYNEDTTLATSPLSQWRDDSKKITDIDFNDQYADDCFGRLYIKEDAGNVVAAVIAFRGTKPFKIGNDLSDVDIGLGNIPSHEKKAVAFYQHSRRYLRELAPCPLHLTGHSLGGAYAQVTAIKSAQHPITVVFNSPGVGDLKGISAQGNYDYIHNFNAKDGAINKVGKTIGDVTELTVSAGETRIKIGNILDKIPLPYVLLPGLGIEASGKLAQHSIVNLIAAIKALPKVAKTTF